jgi:hypothetical protein
LPSLPRSLPPSGWHQRGNARTSQSPCKPLLGMECSTSPSHRTTSK